MLHASDLPDTGQLVRIRGRHWVVTEVAPTALPFDIKSINVGEGQTTVTLSSVEDDGLGQELRILWELEAGRKVSGTATLPDLSQGRFDDPATLGAFLDALHWGAVTNAETTVLQAPFRAGIAIEDYQLEPATRALAMPRVNLLVADDIGPGKNHRDRPGHPGTTSISCWMGAEVGSAGRARPARPRRDGRTR
jgi:hypothetical protein